MYIHGSRLSALALLALHVSAALWYDDPTDSCTTSHRLGTTVYCCNGAGIGSDTFDGCRDASPQPLCPASQVMKTGPANVQFIDRGLGNCWGGDECQWGSNQWEWTCCDCPPGSVPETPGVCPEPDRGSRYCVHCTESDETLVYSDASSSYVCTTPSFDQRACDMAKSASSAFDKAGVFATWAGIFCPLTAKPDIMIAVVQDLIAVQHAWIDKGNEAGVTNPNFEAASAVVTSLAAALLGALVVAALPEEGALAAVAAAAGSIADIYVTVCNAASKGGAALTVASNAAEGLAESALCPDSSHKRSTSDLLPIRIIASTLNIHFMRDNGYNPCSELLSFFPVDLSIPEELDDACTDLKAYDLSDTLSSDVASVTSVMQSFCSAYQSSGNSTTVMEFADFLTNVQKAESICNYSIVTANSTSSTTSSAPSLSSSQPATTNSTTSAFSTGSSSTRCSSGCATNPTSIQQAESTISLLNGGVCRLVLQDA